MRLKLGDPTSASTRAASTFRRPAAHRSPLPRAGVTTLLIDDGETALMTDGFFSGRACSRSGSPGRRRRAHRRCLARRRRPAGGGAPGAHPLRPRDGLGSGRRTHRCAFRRRESTAQIGRGHGLPEDRIRVATPGEPITFGGVRVTLIESHHCPPDRFPGEITEPVVPPSRPRRTSAVRPGRSLVHHRPSDRRCWSSAAPASSAVRWPGSVQTWCTSASANSACSPRNTSSTTGPRPCDGRRPARRAHSLGRLLPATAQAATGIALCGRRSRRDDAGAVPAGR